MFGYIKKAKVIALLDKEIETLKVRYNTSAEELIRYAHAGLGQTLEHEFEQKKCDEYMAQLDEAYYLRGLIEKEVV